MLIYNKYNVLSVILLLVFVIIYFSKTFFLFTATLVGLLTVTSLPLIAFILSFFSKGRSKWVIMIVSIVLFIYIGLITTFVIGYRYFGEFAP